MEDAFLFFLSGIIIGIALALFMVAYVRSIVMQRIIIATRETMEEFKKHVIPCRLEFENDVIFMYRKDNGLFLGQGLTYKELEEQLEKTYPGKIFDVDIDELDEAKVISKLNERKSNVRSS